jgi:thiol-disulfide isomerase/thioredoxin
MIKMKNVMLTAALLLCAGFVFSQTEISHDASGTKIIRGFMTGQELSTDTAFTWFAENQKGYTPEASALQAFRANKDSIRFLAFGGTWCGDTKNILPKFYSLTNAAGIQADRITLLGVDHDKKTIQHLSELFHITNVPTIIVLKNGKEIGRVVEYGRYGMFDKELGEIINSSVGK